MRDGANGELARAKIEADNLATLIEKNLASLRELAPDHSFLFNDAQQLVLKANDDLVLLINARITEYKAEEERRLEAEREKKEVAAAKNRTPPPNRLLQRRHPPVPPDTLALRRHRPPNGSPASPTSPRS